MSLPLVLASQSPRRVDVLRQLGLDPTVQPADVDETRRQGESPRAYVERLAREKAEAVANQHPGALVVGGDTVVVDSGGVLEKPSDPADAIQMVLRLSGSTHTVLSGVALAGPGDTVSGVAETTVRMREYDEATARAYVATGEPLDKAGGYGIQGQGAALVDSIDGDYYAVVGFPVGLFLELVEQAGCHFDFESLRALDD